MSCPFRTKYRRRISAGRNHTTRSPPNTREKFLNTPNASVTGPVVSPEYEHIDGQAQAAEHSNHWSSMAYLSDIEDEAYRTKILAMLDLQKQMRSVRL